MTATIPAPLPTSAPAAAAVDARCDRLSVASQRRIIEPEEVFDWSTLGAGQVIADDLLSVRDLALDLTPDQRARLSREEVAAMLGAGIRFEAVLMAALGLLIAERYELRDPRVTYMLHEIGEETRHSRAFARLIEALDPKARNPLDRAPLRFVQRRIVRSLFQNPSLLMVFVLAGEEIPDMLQRRASEHPGTDPLLAAVNRYHRQEEARHLAFARMVLPEWWQRASRVERWRVRHLAPLAIQMLFEEMVHPGVYATVGLPAFATWRAANRTRYRRELRYEGTRPILTALLDAGVLRRGRVPARWRQLCGVDRAGRPLDASPAASSSAA